MTSLEKLQSTSDVVPGLASRFFKEFEAVRPRIESWTYIDYANYLNCGDAALYLGARRVAKANGAKIVQVLDRRSYGDAIRRKGNGIVYAGGGNWGGLYPTHHSLRLQLLRDTIGTPILQLPQSINYADETHRDDLRRAVAEHGKVTLLVRDQQSYDIATKDYECEVRLTPDIVFSLGRMTRFQPTRRVSVQSRTDREGGGDAGATAAAAGETVWDWLETDRFAASDAALAASGFANRVQKKLDLSLARRVAADSATTLAWVNFTRARRMLSQGQFAITDRLHGHILSTIFGIPHVVVNDRYGKISALRETWTAADTLHEYAPTWSDATAAFERLEDRFGRKR